MKIKILSETLILKLLVKDFVINGARREQRRVFFMNSTIMFFILLILMTIGLSCNNYKIINRSNIIKLRSNNTFYSYLNGHIVDSGIYIKKHNQIELTSSFKNKKIIIDSVVNKNGVNDSMYIVLKSFYPKDNCELNFIELTPLKISNIYDLFSGINRYKVKKESNFFYTIITCDLKKYMYGFRMSESDSIPSILFYSDTIKLAANDSIIINSNFNFNFRNKFFYKTKFIKKNKTLIPVLPPWRKLE